MIENLLTFGISVVSLAHFVFMANFMPKDTATNKIRIAIILCVMSSIYLMMSPFCLADKTDGFLALTLSYVFYEVSKWIDGFFLCDFYSRFPHR